MLPLGIQSWDAGGQGQIKALEEGRREAERIRECSPRMERDAAWGGWPYPHPHPCPPDHLRSSKWTSALCNQGFTVTQPSLAAPHPPLSLCAQPLNRHLSNSAFTENADPKPAGLEWAQQSAFLTRSSMPPLSY